MYHMQNFDIECVHCNLQYKLRLTGQYELQSEEFLEPK